MLPQAIMTLNGKGGVLKSSVTAEIAGIAAAGGWRTLAIDLDPQGNLGRDLGYIDKSDDGASLLSAVREGEAVKPLMEVRPGLDVVPGGKATREVANHLTSEAMAGRVGSAVRMVERTLLPLAADYDLVVVDCPPGEALIHAAAMTAAHYVVIPTQPDDGSIDGLGRVFEQFVEVRGSSNPNIEILGVVIGPVVSNGKKIVRRTRSKLEDLLGQDARVFDTTVRFAQAAAVDLRERGVLAAEYEEEAANAQPWYRMRGKKQEATSFSSAAGGLAEDYTSLVREILGAFSESQQRHAERVAGGA